MQRGRRGGENNRRRRINDILIRQETNQIDSDVTENHRISRVPSKDFILNERKNVKSNQCEGLQ